MMYHWYLAPDKFSRMYKDILNEYWKCKKGLSIIYSGHVVK